MSWIDSKNIPSWTVNSKSIYSWVLKYPLLFGYWYYLTLDASSSATSIPVCWNDPNLAPDATSVARQNIYSLSNNINPGKLPNCLSSLKLRSQLLPWFKFMRSSSYAGVFKTSTLVITSVSHKNIIIFVSTLPTLPWDLYTIRLCPPQNSSNEDRYERQFVHLFPHLTWKCS